MEYYLPDKIQIRQKRKRRRQEEGRKRGENKIVQEEETENNEFNVTKLWPLILNRVLNKMPLPNHILSKELGGAPRRRRRRRRRSNDNDDENFDFDDDVRYEAVEAYEDDYNDAEDNKRLSDMTIIITKIVNMTVPLPIRKKYVPPASYIRYYCKGHCGQFRISK